MHRRTEWLGTPLPRDMVPSDMPRYLYRSHVKWFIVCAAWLVLICMTWLIHMRGMTRSYEIWLVGTWYDAFICNMTRSHVTQRIHMWHDSFICVACLIHMWHMTRARETWLLDTQHDSFTRNLPHPYATQLIICDMTHLSVIWHIADPPQSQQYQNKRDREEEGNQGGGGRGVHDWEHWREGTPTRGTWVEWNAVIQGKALLDSFFGFADTSHHEQAFPFVQPPTSSVNPHTKSQAESRTVPHYQVQVTAAWL